MANNFKSFTLANVGVTDSAIYTGPSSTQTTIIGLNLANKLSTSINANVRLKNSDTSQTVYIVKDAPIPTGSSLVPVGGEQKLVMLHNDVLYLSSSDSNSIDASMSVLEIT
tara:strand:- start:159 stop:491 length:333 start_codon:yes stop_codon:yes gene_type:complete